MNSPRTILVCEDGTTHTGEPYGARGAAVGNLQATTAMTGYQETLTAGAYEGSILLFTTPHVGTTGVNDEDATSPVRARGLVLREHPRTPSNWRSQRSLEEDLLASGTVGIVGVDTRALMRHLRRAGTLKVGIFSGETRPVGELVKQVRAGATNADALVSSITRQSTTRTGEGPAVAVIDLGLGTELTASLAARGRTVVTLPATATLAEIQEGAVSHVILSGGPGNPADATVGLGLARELLATDLPILGLGLGHQILARALGFATKPLAHPHHGVNHPVQDRRSGKVDITCHSHDYTVDFAGSDEVEITHVSLNDGSVEGFALKGRDVRGYQFHPASRSGPSDAHHLLDSFLAKEA